MRLKVTLELKGHSSPDTTTNVRASEEAWRVITDALGQLRGADADRQAGMRRWLGGAAAVYAAVTGRTRESVWQEMERVEPLVKPPATSEPVVQDPNLLFKPGRSTPPPPKHPGAQKPADPEVA